jgi:transcriptional regulator with XRE-family HTH domain
MIQNQFARRNLTAYVHGELGLKLKEFFKKKAEENRSKASIASNINRKYGSQENYIDPVSPNSAKPEIQNVDVREEVAKITGLGHSTISQIEKIKKLAPVEIKDNLESRLRSSGADKISINQAVKFVEALKEAPETARGQIGKHVLEQYNNNPKISLETAVQAAIKEHIIKEAEEKKKQAEEQLKKEQEENERREIAEMERLKAERIEKERQEKAEANLKLGGRPKKDEKGSLFSGVFRNTSIL